MKTKYNIGDKVYCMETDEEFEDMLEIRLIEIVKIEINRCDILYKDFLNNGYHEQQLGKTIDELKKNMIKGLLDYTQKEKKKIMLARLNGLESLLPEEVNKAG